MHEKPNLAVATGVQKRNGSAGLTRIRRLTGELQEQQQAEVVGRTVTSERKTGH